MCAHLALVVDEILEVGAKLLQLLIKLPDSILKVIKLKCRLQCCRKGESWVVLVNLHVIMDVHFHLGPMSTSQAWHLALVIAGGCPFFQAGQQRSCAHLHMKRCQ